MLLPAPIGFGLMADSDASIAVSPSIWVAPLSKPSRFARNWAQTHGAAIQESGASKEDLCFLAIETAAVGRDGAPSGIGRIHGRLMDWPSVTIVLMQPANVPSLRVFSA